MSLVSVYQGLVEACALPRERPCEAPEEASLSKKPQNRRAGALNGCQQPLDLPGLSECTKHRKRREEKGLEPPKLKRRRKNLKPKNLNAGF